MQWYQSHPVNFANRTSVALRNPMLMRLHSSASPRPVPPALPGNLTPDDLPIVYQPFVLYAALTMITHLVCLPLGA